MVTISSILKPGMRKKIFPKIEIREIKDWSVVEPREFSLGDSATVGGLGHQPLESIDFMKEKFPCWFSFFFSRVKFIFYYYA